MVADLMNGKPLGKVYFLVMSDPREVGTDFGLVKVGITRGDVAGRISGLQTGNPYDLFCVEAFETPWANEVEHFMHRVHASEMHKNEWLICPRNGLDALVAEAKGAARRIEERKRREQDSASRISNGKSRRATPSGETPPPRRQKAIQRTDTLRTAVEAAENLLKASTGVTYGISGIVGVKYVPATLRFSEAVARSRFPSVVSECIAQRPSSLFRWRGVPTPRKFPYQNAEAKAAEQ